MTEGNYALVKNVETGYARLMHMECVMNMQAFDSDG